MPKTIYTHKCLNPKCSNTTSTTFCSPSCASSHNNAQRKVKKITQYDLNPNKCKNKDCNNDLDYTHRYNQFCSHSCSSHTNNVKRNPSLRGDNTFLTKSKYQKSICIYCQKDFGYNPKKKDGKYCSDKCKSTDERIKNRKDLFETGLISERSSLKKFIIIIRDTYNCNICDISTWVSKPISLQLDHIDGNAGNNMPDNLRLLCPNCHSQTPSFGSKNKGNGRKARGLPLR